MLFSAGKWTDAIEMKVPSLVLGGPKRMNPNAYIHILNLYSKTRYEDLSDLTQLCGDENYNLKVLPLESPWLAKAHSSEPTLAMAKPCVDKVIANDTVRSGVCEIYAWSYHYAPDSIMAMRSPLINPIRHG